MIRNVVCSLALAAATVSVAIAQDQPPQVERWELMDEMGDQAKIMGDMVKGETEWDAAAVDEALGIIIADSERFPALFPEGSETGHDTRALPAIWQNKADFDQKSQDLVVAATAARETVPEGLPAFALAFREMGQTCRACHTEYRAEDE